MPDVGIIILSRVECSVLTCSGSYYTNVLLSVEIGTCRSRWIQFAKWYVTNIKSVVINWVLLCHKWSTRFSSIVHDA